MNVEPVELNLELISYSEFLQEMSFHEICMLWQDEAKGLAIYNRIRDEEYQHNQPFYVFNAYCEEELFIQYYLRFRTVGIKLHQLKEHAKNFTFDFMAEDGGQAPEAYNQALIDSEERLSGQILGCELLYNKLKTLVGGAFHTLIVNNLPYPAEVNLHTFFDPEFNPQL